MIKNWKQFNESISIEDNDLEKVLNYIASNIPSSEIPKLKSELMPLKESVLNENIFTNIKKCFF